MACQLFDFYIIGDKVSVLPRTLYFLHTRILICLGCAHTNVTVTVSPMATIAGGCSITSPNHLKRGGVSNTMAGSNDISFSNESGGGALGAGRGASIEIYNEILRREREL